MSIQSHPTWVRELKPVFTRIITPVFVSHPTWVRELKQFNLGKWPSNDVSHPTWVRELKHDTEDWSEGGEEVAPHMGA